MIDYKKYGERIVVGVSGGKDSTATCLHLIEQGFAKGDFDRVFLDVGWEHSETYRYLDELEKTIGPIVRLRQHVKVKKEHQEIVNEIEKDLGHESDFVRYMVRWADFPSYFRKWCTRELKLKPLKRYLRALEFEPINAIGIRWAESKKRAEYSEWEWNKHLDVYSYRPILKWSYEDVIAIHRRFGLSPNPLYLKHSDRVGCYPCIYTRKDEIRYLEDARVRVIEKLESHISQTRGVKMGFLRNQPIRDILEWSKTALGGQQYRLFDIEPRKCEKWGMCGA